MTTNSLPAKVAAPALVGVERFGVLLVLEQRFQKQDVGPEQVDADSLDAIVLSANSVEDELIERGGAFRLPVIRLYGERSPRIVRTSDRSLVA